MSENLMNIYSYLSIILLVLSIFLLFRRSVPKKLYSGRKITIIRITYLLIFIIAVFNDCGLRYFNATMASRRQQGFTFLRQLAEMQREYYYKNGRYAVNFEELGVESYVSPTNNWKRASNFDTGTYTYYLNNDMIGRNDKLPEYILKDPFHIYAVRILQLGDPYDPDVLSVDFCGNIEIIESFDKWPLPEPD